MEIQKVNEYTFSDCFTFSPNWYNEAGIAYDHASSLLFYCSNSLVYVYEIQCRQILKQKQFPMEIVENAKAHCVLPVGSNILIGMNDGILLVLNKEYQLINSINTKLKSLSVIVECNTQFILIDQLGSCIKLKLNGEMEVKISGKKCRPKKLIKVQHNWVLFYQNGDIHLFDSNFDKEARKLHWFKNQSVLSIDYVGNRLLILSRNQQQLIITYCQFTYGHQFPVEHTKTIYEISKNVFRCSVSIDYPKKFQYKRQEMRKASLTLKWINSLSFMLSGKIGEIYTFQLQNCLGKKKLQLRPFSNIEEQVGYQVVPDSHHFEDIYAAYTFGNSLLTIGTDRNLTFWTTQEHSISFEYQIRFFASKVRSIFRSECEKNICFVLMDNSVIRSWDVEQHIKGEGLLNQYWKVGKKYRIERISSCPSEEGIIAILTAENEVVIYDLHEERVIRQLKVGDDTKQIGFVDVKILKSLCEFLQHEPYEVNIEQKQLFKRTFPEGWFIAMYDKNYISFFDLQTKKCYRLGKFFKDMNNLQFVQDFFYSFDMIVSVVKSPQTFSLYIFNGSKPVKHLIPQQYVTHKYYIRILGDGKILISLWKNKDINLFLLNVSNEVQVISGHCHFNYYVNYTELSLDGKRLLCYSNLNSTLQIWDLSFTNQSISTTSRNIKAHQGNVVSAGFYNNKYVISCSQDQTLKVWDCDYIPEKAPPKGTKTKKKKKKMDVEGGKKDNQKQKQQSSQQEI